MFTPLSDQQTMVVLLGVLAVSWFVSTKVINAIDAWNARKYEDMDSVRDSMNYQAYIDARKVGVEVIAPFEFEGATTPGNVTVEHRYTDADGLVRVNPITEVRTDTHRPRPIRDRPQG